MAPARDLRSTIRRLRPEFARILTVHVQLRRTWPCRWGDDIDRRMGLDTNGGDPLRNVAGFSEKLGELLKMHIDIAPCASAASGLSSGPG